MHRCLGAVERGGGHVEFRKLWAPRVGSAAGSARHWWGAGPLGARREPDILRTIPQSEINAQDIIHILIRPESLRYLRNVANEDELKGHLRALPEQLCGFLMVCWIVGAALAAHLSAARSGGAGASSGSQQ